ncbi:uncharacterized protein AKAW2_31147A [Aspergillus luchuensis]|uniref:Uncharacterized protein n=1 Tax=Aspergillus kawachii TaxID=1069201 RepID=A0A7R7W7J8_ASPKA|nr:uncharacterized protein AKAW2_31147A [Aspergillus luchuensis]BCR97828.1 hypothetical protein AKAW2_31147A [Aspergillus luchuensis]
MIGVYARKPCHPYAQELQLALIFSEPVTQTRLYVQVIVSHQLALSLHTVAPSSPAATSHDFPQLQTDLRWGFSCYIDLIHRDSHLFRLSYESTRGLRQMFGV